MNCQMKPRCSPSRLNAPYSRTQLFDRVPLLYSRKKTTTLNTKRTIVIDQGVGALSLLMYWRSANMVIETSHRVVFFQRAFHSIQRRQFLTHERHQRVHGFCAEVKAAAGGGE